MAKAYLFARACCGDCKNPMVLDEFNMTVRCPNMHCVQFNQEYQAPTVTLKKPPKKDSDKKS